MASIMSCPTPDGSNPSLSGFVGVQGALRVLPFAASLRLGTEFIGVLRDARVVGGHGLSLIWFLECRNLIRVALRAEVHDDDN